MWIELSLECIHCHATLQIIEGVTTDEKLKAFKDCHNQRQCPKLKDDAYDRAMGVLGK